MIKKLTQMVAVGLIGLSLPGLAEQDGWEKDSEYNRHFDPNQIVTISGRVTDIDREYRPLPGMGPGLAAVIRCDDGSYHTVEVGPVWFTSHFRRRWNVQIGDPVEVTGSRISLNGRKIIMAIRGRKGDLCVTCRNREGQPLWDLDVEEP